MARCQTRQRCWRWRWQLGRECHRHRHRRCGHRRCGHRCPLRRKNHLRRRGWWWHRQQRRGENGWGAWGRCWRWRLPRALGAVGARARLPIALFAPGGAVPIAPGVTAIGHRLRRAVALFTAGACALCPSALLAPIVAMPSAPGFTSRRPCRQGRWRGWRGRGQWPRLLGRQGRWPGAAVFAAGARVRGPGALVPPNRSVAGAPTLTLMRQGGWRGARGGARRWPRRLGWRLWGLWRRRWRRRRRGARACSRQMTAR